MGRCLPHPVPVSNNARPRLRQAAHRLPGYLYQVLVTNLMRTVPPLKVWRDYNGRAACENVIKELDAGYGLPQLIC